LIPLAGKIDEDASFLSVRGNVLENGMPRFFRRLAEGIFDEEDLIFRTKELYEFLDEASQTYEFDRKNIIAIGYSNGANIAASLLFHYQDALKGAILHHPMVPLRGIELPDLTGVTSLLVRERTIRFVRLWNQETWKNCWKMRRQKSIFTGSIMDTN
jgi:phospholipase/carboxylesterase